MTAAADEDGEHLDSEPIEQVRTVLVGFDGSPGSVHALDWAIAEADRHDAALRVVYVLTGGQDGNRVDAIDDGLREAHALLDEAVTAAAARTGLSPRRVDAELIVTPRTGPAATLAVCATEADLLVVGSRGRGGFAGLRLGSVSAQCAAHAPCPVAIIPAPAAERPSAGRRAGQEQRIYLRDGTPALLRPIRPDDKDRLRRGLQQLSSQSRYLRFHAAVSELTDEQLAYLTEVDQHDHVAWVAVNPHAPDEPGMGVARYVRVKDEPTVAEAAVTVADHYQGRGLGTALLELITERAHANGIEQLRNYVLEENVAMLEVLDGLGATRTLAEPGVWQVDVAVPEPSEGALGSPARRLFGAFGRGLLTWSGLAALRRVSKP